MPLAALPNARVVRAPTWVGEAIDCLVACRAALASPIGSSRLRDERGARVTVIVSDGTRDEPRADMLRAVFDELGPRAEMTVVIANGTHAAGPLPLLGELPAGARVVQHDGHAIGGWVEVGTTRRGLRVRYPEWLLATDLIVVTGRIRPHYFAGFGAGAKGLFPGLGQNDDIRANHRLKSERDATLGRCDGNPCREDLEEAAALVGRPTHLLNVVMTDDGRVAGAFAGDVVAAHRAGCALARTMCVARVDRRARAVVVSGPSPIADSLYQASKLLVPAGMALEPGGVAVLVAECRNGVGPVDVVNQAIWTIGVSRYFRDAIIYLVSSLPESVVAQTYCRFAPSVEWALAQHPAAAGDVIVMPDAQSLIPEVLS